MSKAKRKTRPKSFTAEQIAPGAMAGPQLGCCDDSNARPATAPGLGQPDPNYAVTTDGRVLERTTAAKIMADGLSAHLTTLAALGSTIATLVRTRVAPSDRSKVMEIARTLISEVGSGSCCC